MKCVLHLHGGFERLGFLWFLWHDKNLMTRYCVCSISTSTPFLLYIQVHSCMRRHVVNTIIRETYCRSCVCSFNVGIYMQWTLHALGISGVTINSTSNGFQCRLCPHKQQ